MLEEPNTEVLDEPNIGLLVAPNAPSDLNTGTLDTMISILAGLVELKVGVLITVKAGVLITAKGGVVIAPMAGVLVALNEFMV